MSTVSRVISFGKPPCQFDGASTVKNSIVLPQPIHVVNVQGDITSAWVVDWSDAPKDAAPHVRINSMGGDLNTSVNTMRRLMQDKRHVITENFGHAESGGFAIFLGGAERISGREGVFLFHSGSYSGKLKTHEMANFSRTFEPCFEMQIDRLSKISKHGKKFWLDVLTSGRDQYFTAKQLYDIGVVTKLI